MAARTGDHRRAALGRRRVFGGPGREPGLFSFGALSRCPSTWANRICRSCGRRTFRGSRPPSAASRRDSERGARHHVCRSFHVRWRTQKFVKSVDPIESPSENDEEPSECRARIGLWRGGVGSTGKILKCLILKFGIFGIFWNCCKGPGAGTRSSGICLSPRGKLVAAQRGHGYRRDRPCASLSAGNGRVEAYRDTRISLPASNLQPTGANGRLSVCPRSAPRGARTAVRRFER